MATLNPLKGHMSGPEVAAAVVMGCGYVLGKGTWLLAQLAWARITTRSPEEKADTA
jgi:hypothetical protein